MTKMLYYLGPSGSFTHQAALKFAVDIANSGVASVAGHLEPEPCESVPDIMEHVEAGEGWGVIAWENNVEGPVIPNLDALIDAHNVAGFARVSETVAFDAFVVPGVDAPPTRIVAHPHGLAQCQGFARRMGLKAVPASSNAAACKNLRPGQVALGPSICGSLYGLQTLEGGVQDYEGAHTDFLVVAPRDEVSGKIARALALGAQDEDGGICGGCPVVCDDASEPSIGDRADCREFETIFAVVPLSTGPGVMSRLLDRMRDEGLNMTSLMSRPIKGHDGTYSFIITLDAAPWEANFHALLDRIVARGDWVKTLAVYERGARPNPPVDTWMLPKDGICTKRDMHGNGVEVGGQEQANDRDETMVKRGPNANAMQFRHDGIHHAATATMNMAQLMERELLWSIQ
ncbi:chorismate mutase / prephenate dehydratase [Bifidobacterium bohemicum]|uniref:prephenate dehydratase n=1 Tax=Bifidobacterium bohemicum DSM 22767 TaxID=1437606 RepID=A0A086ZG95_9BIFI|nr:prephenate dehydratase domain-containing protein [Bifidobacterium bohemicum]KFI45545.1 Prephenate dehydratase [Bifidobacterium bohemicum DSM 22767]SCC02267.1 chorismate mutase / prephenate dehydratase [Bifidobacterium bohemicum]